MHPVMVTDEYLTKEVRDEHRVCIQGRHRPLHQSLIALTPQSFRFVHPPPKYATCSPVPNAVKRISHTPFCSTTDRSLTSFFRLPYDIRLQIYGYLLLCNNEYDRVYYELCVPTRHLVMRRRYYRWRMNYPFERHGMFPSILQCCRATHAEGVPLLYGRNQFLLLDCGDIKDRTSAVMNSFPIADVDMRRITKLSMWPGWGSYADIPSDGTLAQYCRAFDRLRDVVVNIQISPTEWDGYVAGNAPWIAIIDRVRFNIQVPMTYSRTLWKQRWSLLDLGESLDEDDEKEERRIMTEWLVDNCLRLYRTAAEKANESVGKRMTWDASTERFPEIPYVIIDLLWESP